MSLGSEIARCTCPCTSLLSPPNSPFVSGPWMDNYSYRLEQLALAEPTTKAPHRLCIAGTIVWRVIFYFCFPLIILSSHFCPPPAFVSKILFHNWIRFVSFEETEQTRQMNDFLFQSFDYFYVSPSHLYVSFDDRLRKVRMSTTPETNSVIQNRIPGKEIRSYEKKMLSYKYQTAYCVVSLHVPGLF